jgi:hypothetical protein
MLFALRNLIEQYKFLILGTNLYGCIMSIGAPLLVCDCVVLKHPWQHMYIVGCVHKTPINFVAFCRETGKFSRVL